MELDYVQEPIPGPVRGLRFTTLARPKPRQKQGLPDKHFKAGCRQPATGRILRVIPRPQLPPRTPMPISNSQNTRNHTFTGAD